MTSERAVNLPKYASAGGHELHPCDVNSSTTMGRDGVSAPARLHRIAVETDKMTLIRRFLVIVLGLVTIVLQNMAGRVSRCIALKLQLLRRKINLLIRAFGFLRS